MLLRTGWPWLFTFCPQKNYKYSDSTVNMFPSLLSIYNSFAGKVSTVTNLHLVAGKSISGPSQGDLPDRKLPNLCEGICSKCSYWLGRIPCLLSSGITLSPYWMHPQPLGRLCWTELMSLAGDKWSDSIFSTSDVTLMDTSNFFPAWNPFVHKLSAFKAFKSEAHRQRCRHRLCS